MTAVDGIFKVTLGPQNLQVYVYTTEHIATCGCQAIITPASPNLNVKSGNYISIIHLKTSSLYSNTWFIYIS